MFCKYCGKPVDEGTMRCRICGRPVGPLEGGNGFWDLAGGKEKSAADAAQAAPGAAPTGAVPRAGFAAAQPPKPGPAASASSEELRALRGEVERLRREASAQSAPKTLPTVSLAGILLGLLALALGVIALFQVHSINGKMQSLEGKLMGREFAATEKIGEESALTPAPTPADQTLPETTPAPTPAEEGSGEPGAQEDTSGTEPAADGSEEAFIRNSTWKGEGLLEGVKLQPAREFFKGPNKGEGDNKGQSIRLGQPEFSEQTTIFRAQYIGPLGTYQFHWVKVESYEETRETWFTPLLEDDGYIRKDPTAADLHNPDASEQQKSYTLYIKGEVKEDHLGYYALVAVDTQSNTGYVSRIVLLYDRDAPQDGQGTSSDGQSDVVLPEETWTDDENDQEVPEDIYGD